MNSSNKIRNGCCRKEQSSSCMSARFQRSTGDERKEKREEKSSRQESPILNIQSDRKAQKANTNGYGCCELSCYYNMTVPDSRHISTSNPYFLLLPLIPTDSGNYGSLHCMRFVPLVPLLHF